jgi:hypothetical protein
MLDDRWIEKGKGKDVMCSEVQLNLYDPASGKRRYIQVDEEDQEKHSVDPQALGMLNARNRGKVGQVARLLVHFGFARFTSGSCVRPWLQQEDVDIIWKKKGTVQPVQSGTVIHDETHAKGEWGLRWANIGLESWDYQFEK